MLPRIDITVHGVAPADTLPPVESVNDTRQEQYHRSLTSLLGQTLEAEVLEQLHDGSFLVKLEDATTTRLALPADTQTGSKVPLTLVSLDPRPVFQLANQGDQVSLSEGKTDVAAELTYTEHGTLAHAAPAAPAEAPPPSGAAPALPAPAAPAGSGNAALARSDLLARPVLTGAATALLAEGKPLPPGALTSPALPPQLAAAALRVSPRAAAPNVSRLSAPDADTAPDTAGLAQPEFPREAGVAAALPPAAATLTASAGASRVDVSVPPAAAPGIEAAPAEDENLPAVLSRLAESALAAVQADDPASPPILPPAANAKFNAAAAPAQATPATPAARPAATGAGAQPANLQAAQDAVPAPTLNTILSQPVYSNVRAADVPRATALANAAALLSRAPLVPSERLPALGAGATPATLSDTARVLNEVLRAAGSAGANTTPISSNVPLLAGNAAPQPPAVADTLAQSIGKSGLFYESHVADWASGQLPLSELAQEPQMQPAGRERTDSAQFINQQLATQEQAKVSWQGPIWPGVPMQWDVARDDTRQSSSQTPQDKTSNDTWRSGLRLRFPGLGNVEAKLVLNNGRLDLRIHADDPASAEALRAQAPALESALAAAGLSLTGFGIHSTTGDGHG